MTDELKWIKNKLIKMEALEHITWGFKCSCEKMGLIETLQIKSSNMYGYKDDQGRDKIYIGPYTECGDYNQLFK